MLKCLRFAVEGLDVACGQNRHRAMADRDFAVNAFLAEFEHGGSWACAIHWVLCPDLVVSSSGRSLRLHWENSLMIGFHGPFLWFGIAALVYSFASGIADQLYQNSVRARLNQLVVTYGRQRNRVVRHIGERRWLRLTQHR